MGQLDWLLAVPSIAAMRSSHTAVGVLATRLPPGSAVAFARHSGFTYPVTPAYGLSTRGPGVPVARVVGGVVTRDVGGVVTREVGGVVTRVVGGVVARVVGAVVTTGPLQLTPLTVNEVGTELVPFQLAMKPKATLPPVGT